MAMRTINEGFDALCEGQDAAGDVLQILTTKVDDQAGQMSMVRSDIRGLQTQMQTLISLVTAATSTSVMNLQQQQHHQGQYQEAHGEPRKDLRQHQHVLSHVQFNQQQQPQQSQKHQQQQQQLQQEQQQQQRKKQPTTFHCDACYAIQQERLDEEYTNDDELSNGRGPLNLNWEGPVRAAYKQAYRKLRCVRTSNIIGGIHI